MNEKVILWIRSTGSFHKMAFFFLIICKEAVNFALVKFTNLQMSEQTRYKCRNKLATNAGKSL